MSAVIGVDAPALRAASGDLRRSLRIQSTAKPKSNFPVIVFHRFCICKLWAVAGRDRFNDLRLIKAVPACEMQPLGDAGRHRNADLVDRLRELANPDTSRKSNGARAKALPPTGSAAKVAGSPPAMTVNWRSRAGLASGGRGVKVADPFAPAPVAERGEETTATVVAWSMMTCWAFGRDVRSRRPRHPDHRPGT